MTDAAFQTFYAQTSNKLWAYLLRICQNAETAKDILQESYLRFLQKPPHREEHAAMQSYLYTIATRLNVDRLKQARRQNTWPYRFFHDEPSAADDVHRTTSLQVDMAAIFSRMKSQERALLWLAYVEEQPHRAIAEILGLREKSVRVVLHRARQKLARILKEFNLDEKVFT
jgi:RNA polymerase sigma-70 factor (ECF subfamily)